MSIAVPFPSTLPNGYAWFEDEPLFDPAKHLALTEPDEIVMLADLGYSESDIAGKATAVAASSPFRVLSDEGAEVMLATARRLLDYARPAGDRIERMTRGGVYRSRWLRDLCLSPEVNDHLGLIYGIEIAPHAMPVHLGHINFQPTTRDTAVDKWHHDTLPLDYVMAVTDPALVHGGEFEYFLGTKDEAASLGAAGQQPPRDRVVQPAFDGPGWAIALHGDMVVHRGAPLTADCERISMVNGYVALDTSVDEQSRHRDLIVVDDAASLYTEWAKHVAWRSGDRLRSIVDADGFEDDPEAVACELEEAIADVTRAIEELRAGERQTVHYEK